MTNLVIMKDQQAVTTSLQVAEVFGKEHKVVLKAIDELKEGVAENSADSFDGVAQNYADLFYEDTYIHPQNKQKYRQIIMNRDGFTLLAMGFTGKKALQFKLQYINAFNEMEKTIKEKSVSIPTTKRGLALLALEASEETNQRVD
ncbi:MAG: Rha family transcriptional regulator, partial [Enterococcus faecium]